MPPNGPPISALQKRPVSLLHIPEDADFTSNKKATLLRRHFLNPFDPTPSATVQSSQFDVSPQATVDDNGEAFPTSSFDDEVCDKFPNDVDLGIAHDNSNKPSNDNTLGQDCTPIPYAAMPPVSGIPQSWSTMYTTDQKWTVSLLKILDEMNAPDYAFESILKWARSASADTYSFYPDGGLSRLRNIDELFSSMKNAKQLLPSVYTVACPHGSLCDVIAFDFVPQLLSLLQSRDLMTQATW